MKRRTPEDAAASELHPGVNERKVTSDPDGRIIFAVAGCGYFGGDSILVASPTARRRKGARRRNRRGKRSRSRNKDSGARKHPDIKGRREETHTVCLGMTQKLGDGKNREEGE